LRALWSEALIAGLSEHEAWQHAMEWALRPPSIVSNEEPAPALVKQMRRKASWHRGDDPDFPWTAKVGREAWRVRLNDFPEEPMYRLFIDGQAVGDFHDWPKAWHRLDEPFAIAAPTGRPPRKAPTPAGNVTNAAAFDTYRRRSEAEIWDAKAWLMIKEPDYGRLERHFRDMLLAWLARYQRRQAAIEGSEGATLADAAARRALIARNRRSDAAATDLPDWDLALKGFLYEGEFRLKRYSADERRLLAGFTVASLAELHGYGPSIRRLWADAKAFAFSEPDAWRRVMAWAVHRPTAWESLHLPVALTERLGQTIRWQDRDDPDFPWAATIDEAAARVRVNDFPDEQMYGLWIGDRHLGDFHDWPADWHRS
jgi:hypothetical protein